MVLIENLNIRNTKTKVKVSFNICFKWTNITEQELLTWHQGNTWLYYFQDYLWFWSALQIITWRIGSPWSLWVFKKEDLKDINTLRQGLWYNISVFIFPLEYIKINLHFRKPKSFIRIKVVYTTHLD